MKPGTREPRKKWGEDKGMSRYDRIRQLRFFPILFLFFNLFLNYFNTFNGTIWEQKKFEVIDSVSVWHSIEMNITVHFKSFSEVIDVYYFLHLICSNIKYVILYFICLTLANLYKSISEKRLFEDKNMPALRLIGVALLAILIFDRLAIYIMNQYVMHHPELFSKLNITLSSFSELIPSSTIYYILIAESIYFMIIEIFRYGIKIQSENDLTV